MKEKQDTVMCPKCSGRGEYSYISDTGGYSHLERFGCWACNGTGRLPEGTVFVRTADLIKCYAERNGLDPGNIKVSTI